uniref:Uncharacterized protein n=1 Tax=Triticum urartu TaxID=4572 RepID=A0A8R7UN53_TRIUA
MDSHLNWVLHNSFHSRRLPYGWPFCHTTHAATGGQRGEW